MAHVKLRADLANTPGYVAGKNPSPPIKLSSNETPFPPLPQAVEAVTRAATTLNRYPDPSASQLRNALAERYHIAPDQIVGGCGSVELCEILIQIAATTGDEVVYGWRSFEVYPILTQRVNVTGVPVANTPEHRLDLTGILDAITPRTRAVFLTTPNNPTGAAITRAELREFLDAAPRDLLIILDEAYAEFVDDPDMADGVRDALHAGYTNVAVLRTLSKAWGLAGVRAGYLLASQQIAAAVLSIMLPFSVSSLAEAASLAALTPEAEAEVQRRVKVLCAERERVYKALSEYVDVPRSHANFVWLPLGERSAELTEYLGQRGVITRHLGDDGVRITIGTPEENDRWVPMVQKFFSSE